MLWDNYVFRRGGRTHDLWDDLFDRREVRLLYITGRGFDLRAQTPLNEIVANLKGPSRKIGKAHLIMVEMSGYELEGDIQTLTEENALETANVFSQIGTSEKVTINSSVNGEEDVSPSVALATGIKGILDQINNQTDIVLDVSSMPRVVYLALLTNLLAKLVSKKSVADGQEHPLVAGGVNFQVLVAEDPWLDGTIRAEDPSNELVLIPGFSGALHAESVQDWPLVWFPLLGENRVSQLEKIIALAPIPESAEICPVLPHPSRNLRRADNLIIEYSKALFESGRAPLTNILYADEANPFEAYRRMLRAMQRYQKSMSILGGVRLVVSPLGSKLITIGAGMACFEMKPEQLDARYGVALPHAEPKRYVVSVENLKQSKPELSSLLLTGDAYKK